MTASGPRWGVPVRVVVLQAAVALLVVALALPWGVDEAKSALLGGVAAWLPNAYFAWRLTRFAGAAGQYAVRAAALVLGQWAAKLALTVALLAAALVVADAGGLSFFAGLGAVLLAPLASPLLGGGESETEAKAKRER